LERALREAESSTSGIELELVQCGARYCQASFFIDDGDVMALNEVLNLSVVEGEAFTVPGDDGTATLFFAAPGISLQELGAEMKVTELSITTTTGASPELSAADASE
jgi:hypothetical protein